MLKLKKVKSKHKKIAPTNWKKIGNPRVLAKKFTRGLALQRFRNKITKKEIDYALFLSKNASIILPITPDGNVVAINQYRFGSCKKQTEIPSGAVDKKESGMDAATRELEEETGYQAKSMINLSPNAPAKALFIDPPAFFLGLHFTFLALGCTKTKKQNLDQSEKIDVHLIPVREWIEMCLDGRIDDQTSLSITFLALPYVKKFGVKFSL